MGHWAAAKMHWLQGNVPSGIESMDRALKLIRGDDQLGTASKQLFRLRLVERLYRDGTWTAEQTRKYLAMLIDNPPRVQWQLEPLESMAALVCEKEIRSKLCSTWNFVVAMRVRWLRLSTWPSATISEDDSHGWTLVGPSSHLHGRATNDERSREE